MAISDGCRVRFPAEPRRATGTFRPPRTDTVTQAAPTTGCRQASMSKSPTPSDFGTLLWEGRSLQREQPQAARAGRYRHPDGI